MSWSSHDPALLQKPTLVAFNKMDQEQAAEAWPAFEKARRAQGVDVVAVSAAAGQGLAELRAKLAKMLPDAE